MRATRRTKARRVDVGQADPAPGRLISGREMGRSIPLTRFCDVGDVHLDAKWREKASVSFTRVQAVNQIYKKRLAKQAGGNQ